MHAFEITVSVFFVHKLYLGAYLKSMLQYSLEYSRSPRINRGSLCNLYFISVDTFINSKRGITSSLFSFSTFWYATTLMAVAELILETIYPIFQIGCFIDFKIFGHRKMVSRINLIDVLWSSSLALYAHLGQLAVKTFKCYMLS